MLRLIQPLLHLPVILLLATANSFAAVTVTPATGGTNISADKAANSNNPSGGEFVLLGVIAIKEGVSSDFAAGAGDTSLILTAPAGWSFRAGFGSASVVGIGGSGASNITIRALVVTAETVRLSFTVGGTNRIDSLTISGLQAKALDGSLIPSTGFIHRKPGAAGGTANISGIVTTSNPDGSGGTNFGSLSQVAGAVSKLAFITQPAGATVGAIFQTQPVVRTRDQFGNNSVSGLSSNLNVNLALTAGTGPLQGTTSLNIGTSGGNGVVTYTNLRIDSAGAGKQLTAIATGLTSATSSVFEVGKGTPAFANLASPTIIFGSTPTLLSGTVSLGTLIPPGNIEITLNGITQFAAINPGIGTFSSSFETDGLVVPSSPYTITYHFPGDDNLLSVTDDSKTLVVEKAAPSFSHLSSPTIVYRSSPTEISGRITSGGLIPPDSVAITLNGVTQHATIASGSGEFSSQFATSSLTVPGSPYAITFNYPGSDNFSAASEGTAFLTVSRAATTTEVDSLTVPFNAGERFVTFSAMVTASLVDEGTVTFQVMDGETPVGNPVTSDPLTDGTASVDYTLPAATAAGEYMIFASYGDASNFDTSSGVSVLTINPAATSAELDSDINPSFYRQEITFTATITPASATGRVFFYADATLLDSSDVILGEAALAISTLPAGEHSLVAVYGGDANHLESTSDTLLQIIHRSITTVEVDSQSTAFSDASQEITLTATVSGSLVDEGTVTFQVMDGETPVGEPVTSDPLTDGTASVGYTLPAGASTGEYLIIAAYSGGFNFEPDTGTGILIIEKAPTTVAVDSQSTAFSDAPQEITLTATVSGSVVNEGTVTFQVMDGETPVGNPVTSDPLTDGTASVDYTLPAATAAGQYMIFARYGDASNFDTSSGVGVLTINPAATSAELDSDINPSFYRQEITFTATITPASVTGRVFFYADATLLDSSDVILGEAALAISTLPAGEHSLVAVYGGDANHLESTSDTLLQIIHRSITTVEVDSQSTTFSDAPQEITLTATVGGSVVNEGTVTFQVMDGETPVGDPVTSDPLTDGTASVGYTLPAGASTGEYLIIAAYSGGFNFEPDTGTGILIIEKAPTTVAVDSQSTAFSDAPQEITLTATVSGSVVNEGTVTFQVMSGETPVGDPVTSDPLTDGTASVGYTLPAGASTGEYLIIAAYSGGFNFEPDTGTGVLIVTRAVTTVGVDSQWTVFTSNAQSITLSATVAGSIVNEGTVIFQVKAGEVGIGDPVLSDTLTDGTASAEYTLPAGTGAGEYSIVATYSGGVHFEPGSGNGVLTIEKTSTTTLLGSAVNPTRRGDLVTFTASVSPSSATGSIAFYNGDELIDSSALSDGAAELSTASLGVGEHAIITIYQGDGNHHSSASDTLHHTVLPSLTTVFVDTQATIYSDQAQFVTLTATVTGSVVDEGTVTFRVFDGETPLGDGQESPTLTDGTASVEYLLPGATSAKEYSILAHYHSGFNFDTSSATGILIVAKATTTVVVDSQSTPYSDEPQTISLSAMVSGSVIDEGILIFQVKDGPLEIGTAVESDTLTNGEAEVTYTLPGGIPSKAYSILVTYSGGTNFDTSSGIGVLALGALPTLIAVDSVTTEYSDTNRTIVLSATVSGSTVNEGTVIFEVFSGSIPVGAATESDTVENGVASVSYLLPAETPVGQYVILATYSGGPVFDTSSGVGTLTIEKAPTTLELISDISPSTYGQEITFTASIDPPSATGMISFFAATTPLGSSPLISGTASIGVHTLTAGIHPISAVYAGDDNFRGSASDTLFQVVNVAPTSVVVDNQIAYYSDEQQAITVTATVTGSIVDQGTVTFRVFDGPDPIGGVVESDPLTDGTASVSYTIPAATMVNSYTILASYSGGSNFDTSSGLGILIVARAPTVVEVDSQILVYSSIPQPLIVTATVRGSVINEGTITFHVRDGDFDLTSPQTSDTLINGEAFAEFLISSIDAGEYTIFAHYGGGTKFDTSSGVGILTVERAPSEIALTSNTDTTVFGEQVTFTAAVTPPQASGTVSFFSDTTLLGSSFLLSGTTHFSTSSLGGGVHKIIARYNGDFNFLESFDTIPHTVALAPTVVSVDTHATVFSQEPQLVSLTATVSGSVVNQGTVTFQIKDGDDHIGTPVTSSELTNGIAEVNYTLPANAGVGEYTIHADYSGGSNFDTSSGVGILLITKVITTVAVDSQTIVYADTAQTVTLTATVTGSVVNEGTVTFQILDGSTPVGSAVISDPLSNGIAEVSYTVPANTPAAEYAISAIYSGGANFEESAGSGVFIVQRAPTVIEVQNQTMVYADTAQTITLTARVSGSVVNQGTVTFEVFDGEVLIGTPVESDTLEDGGVNVNYTIPAGTGVGVYTIVATYNGGPNFQNGVGTAQFEIAKAVTSTHLSSSVNPSSYGQQVTFTATVTPSTAVGNVSFFDSDLLLATEPILSGTASFSTAALNAGIHPIIAVYGGNENYLGSSSDTLQQTVMAALTTVAVDSNTTIFSQEDQLLTLRAEVSGSVVNQGTVTFQIKDGDDHIGTPVTSSELTNGIAEVNYTLPANAGVGEYTIHADYSGGSNFDTSSGVGILLITKVITTVAVDSQTIVYADTAQTVTLTATVTGSVVNEGTVTFQILDGSTPVGSAVISDPLSNGIAEVSYTVPANTPAAEYAISAIYSGGANFEESAGSGVFIVQRAPTVIEVQNQTMVYADTAQTITLTARVSGSVVNQGTVTFEVFDGEVLIGTPVESDTLEDGTANVNYTIPGFTASGLYTIVATYDGQSFLGSSDSATLEVMRSASAILVTASPDPGMYGQPVTLRAQLVPRGGTGLLDFFDGELSLGSAPLVGDTADIVIPSFSVGIHRITVHYEGDDNILAGTSDTLDLLINRATTITAVVTIPDTSTFGDTLAVIATVSPDSATGMVDFFDGTSPIGSTTVVGGSATIFISDFSAGNHPLTAHYSGDGNFLESTSEEFTHVVKKAATMAGLASLPNPSTFGQAVTFTATITPASATGEVVFLNGATPIGASPVVAGVATYSTASLPAGTHNISGSYSGNTNFNPSTTQTIAQVVGKAVALVTVTTDTNTTAAHDSVEFLISLTPNNATGTVQLLVDGVSVASASLTGGFTAIKTLFTEIGTYTISASYSGDNNYVAGASATLLHMVVDKPGAVTLIAPRGGGGFEAGTTFAANGWTVVNGNETNKWFVGTAAKTAGLRGAYVSNNNGVNNQYTINDPVNFANFSVVHFYRDITFPTEHTAITLSFDWRCEGDAREDFLQVLLVADTVQPVAGIELSSGQIGKLYYNLRSQFEKAYISIPPSVAGTTRRLVFTWRNDATLGAQPPAALDNIKLVAEVPQPLSGTRRISSLSSGDYKSVSEAIAHLNAHGVDTMTSGVTFDIPAGELFVEDPPALVARGTSSAPILFRRWGAGPTNPTLRPRGSADSVDYGIGIIGGRHITFDGLDVIVASGNTLVEMGYYVTNSSPAHGSQHITIKNCSITLNRSNRHSRAVLQTVGPSRGGAVPATIEGTNSYNRYYNLTIHNVHAGIELQGSASLPDDSCVVAGIGGSRMLVGQAGDIISIGSSVTDPPHTYGIGLFHQRNVRLFNASIANVVGASTNNADAIYVENGSGAVEIFNNEVIAIRNTLSAPNAGRVTGIHISLSSNPSNVSRVFNNMLRGMYTRSTSTANRRLIGIYVQSIGPGNGAIHNIDFNSVLIDSGALNTRASTNTCFEVGAGAGSIINVRNNIFANNMVGHTGSMKHYTWVTPFANSIGAPGSISERNVLYIHSLANGFIGRTDTVDRATIYDWRTAVQQDRWSRSSNPQFISTTNLHINASLQTPVSGHASYFGDAITWVTHDFDNAVRDSLKPDIGADEGNFIAVQKDIAAFAFLNPTAGGYKGNAPFLPQASFENEGVQTQTNVLVRFMIQGPLPDTTTRYNETVIVASIDGGASPVTVTFPAVALPLTGSYRMRARVELAGDINSRNDQITATFSVMPPLAGNFTVGTSGGVNFPTGNHFPTLTDAIAALDLLDISGPVSFSLTSALYGPQESFPLTFKNYTGSNPTNVITIKPAIGVTPTISGSSSPALIKFEGARHIVIDGSNLINGTSRDLTITNTMNATSATIWVSSLDETTGSTHITVKNSRISGGVLQALENRESLVTWGILSSGPELSHLADGAGNNHNKFQNNLITRVRYGIYLRGAEENRNRNNLISQNTIGPANFGADAIGSAGIVLQFQDSAIVTQNTVRFVGGPLAEVISEDDRIGIGIGAAHWHAEPGAVTNTRITRNHIHNILEEGGRSAVGILLAGSEALSLPLQEDARAVVHSDELSPAPGRRIEPHTSLAIAEATDNHSETRSRPLRSPDVVRQATSQPSTPRQAAALTTRNTVANNMIANVRSNAAVGSRMTGIGVITGEQDRIIYNTVSLTGQIDAGGTAAQESAAGITIASESVRNVELKNNIVTVEVSSRDAELRHFAIIAPSQSFQWDVDASDYNNFYVDPGNPQLKFAGLGTSTPYLIMQNLGDWQSVFSPPQDLNSISKEVFFSSVIDLHLVPPSAGDIDLIGTPIPDIPIDFDGHVRNLEFPYMGADEVDDAPLPITLGSFTVHFDSTAQGVLVEWMTISETNNYGFVVQRRLDSELEFSDIPNSFTPGAGTTIEPQYYSFLDTTLTVTGLYHYRLKQIDLDGPIHYTFSVSIEVTVLSVAEAEVPHVFQVFQNYPNPFNPRTTIRFSVEQVERATVIVYNVLGQEVRSLFDDIAEPGRYYILELDGRSLASGIYFYRVSTESRSEVKKMMLLK